ncbi:hypothetical protein Poli38472_008511 [Pythium oligandrum]|uniref:Arsenical-resistance protein n=1 Tax=Pythium oligandrum TaxID=41045 RepID=A0A8K1C3P1_PYTOL|nr:hypothetical protein Poli38472_008511 [Pythium oligandrum]|eukprot:TMW55863.1 hypothetical protein Poli38472_008511 [Pythium oligandrum]
MSDRSLVSQLSFFDRFLTLWLLLAAAVGFGLGQLDAIQSFIESTTVHNTNILVAIGLIVMMYPPLTKVRWNMVHRVFADWRLLLLTTFQNWVLGPFVMFFLAAAFFHDSPGYLAGLSLVGCARCIAMVVVWNSLAEGDDEYCAAIVAVNSVITIVLYSLYASLLLNDLPDAMNLTTSADITVSMGEVAQNVGIYMGIPFVLAVGTWYWLTKAKGTEWYTTRFTPKIGVCTLAALLFTVLVLFASQSEQITDNIDNVIYAAVPLLLYFIFMFLASYAMAYALGGSYAQSTSIAFTAASNNFELALAQAISAFGLKSDPALMSVVGALIEIPTMLALVYLALYFKKRFYHVADADEDATSAASPADAPYEQLQETSKPATMTTSLA